MLSQFGIHLIEVLVSLFLLSIALFGIDAMLVSTSKEVTALYHLHVAMQQLMQIQERIATEGYVATHLSSWNQQNQTVLPHGVGQYDAGKLSVSWNKGNDVACKESISTIHCLRLEVANY